MERIPLLGIGDAKRLLGYSEGAPLSWSVDPLRNGGVPAPSFLRAFASWICRRIRSDSAAKSVCTGPHLHSNIQL